MASQRGSKSKTVQTDYPHLERIIHKWHPARTSTHRDIHSDVALACKTPKRAPWSQRYDGTVVAVPTSRLRFCKSCDSHFFVVLSSLSVSANVLSLSSAGKHWRRASRALEGEGGGGEGERGRREGREGREGRKVGRGGEGWR